MTHADILPSIGLLVLRLGFGGYMVTHGWGKLQMLLNREAELFGDPIGLGAGLSLGLVTFAEFGCSLLVMAGLATRLATIPIIITMAVAGFYAHGADPWTMGEAYRLFQAGETQFPVSREPAVMFLIAFLTLLLTGPGRLSLDALLWPKLRAGRQRTAAKE